MAVFLGCESGFDHEGDLEVLDAFYRLGLRTVQFATQTGYNAFADSALAPVQGGQKPEHYKGINERGRALVSEMNRLGILIDITHGTEAVHLQLIEASRAPVVASHDTHRAPWRAPACPTSVLKALAAKGGLVGIHGGAAVVGQRYRKWMADNPDKAPPTRARRCSTWSGYKPSVPRAPGDHGEYIEKFDHEFRRALDGARRVAEDPAGAGVRPDRGRMGRAGRLRDQDGRRRPRRDRPRHGGRAQLRAAERRRLRRDLCGDPSASPRRRTCARSAARTGSGSSGRRRPEKDRRQLLLLNADQRDYSGSCAICASRA